MYKSRIAFFLLLLAVLNNSEVVLSQEPEKVQGDQFSKNAVWINCERPVFLESLLEKIVLVVVTDENCVECGFYISELQQNLFFTPSVQIIEVMLGDTNAPVSKHHLLQYIQKNSITHPIGIFPDFSGFNSFDISRLPYFMLYEKSDIPSMGGSGQNGFDMVTSRLKTLREEKSLLESCNNYLIRPFFDPNWFANPAVETPTYLAEQEIGGGLFVNDAAHHRLLGFDQNGNMVLMIGSTISGFQDDGIFTSLFNHPRGMTHHNDKLYIADTYNNRIRIVDMRTEKVSTLLGNGYITWKRTKTIDSKYEPIGFPTDVITYGRKMYVASASSNQIFEVDENTGMAELFCDLPQDDNSLVRNCPLNLSVVFDELMVTMTDGNIYTIDKRGKAQIMPNKDNLKFTAVSEWRDGIAAITRDGNVMFFNKEKWSVVGEADEKRKGKNQVKLSGPTDMINKNGDLYITDTDNHFVRILTSPTDKLMKNFWMKISRELVGFDAAHTLGEVVLMDSVFFSKEEVVVNVLLDLHGYKLVAGGQNESLISEGTGTVMVKSETIDKEEFTIMIKSTFPDPEIYVEVYLTLEHPDSPGLYVIKRAYLDFPVIEVDKADKVQEQIYTPTLLPY